MGKVKTNFKTKRSHFIKAWRKYRKLTLEQVAERLDVTAGALSQLERGDIGYTQPMLEALAEALNCEPSDLIVRDPGASAGIMLIWDQIPEADRAQALKVLSQFKRTGTNG